MNRFFSFLFVFSLIGSLFSLNPITYAQEDTKTSTYTVSPFEQEVFDLVNEERKKQNVKPLILSLKVSKLAREKSEDMRDKDYFDHHSPTYGDPCEHMKKQGVGNGYCGENIAAGSATPKEVMERWMKSEGHRANILNKNYTHIGVGYAKGGRYGTYWTQQFYGEQ
ncbi:CAP domain-containing protein [Shimazuella kribbensis]|uniref:CAP domain-containing protein n=1 Tax=Shimazuella kribbensis TaxID=139808 RepID=UPI0003F82E96|nr:CAP domain-containing protein [Shimazuella kribbensis]